MLVNITGLPVFGQRCSRCVGAEWRVSAFLAAYGGWSMVFAGGGEEEKRREDGELPGLEDCGRICVSARDDGPNQQRLQ